MRSKDTFEFVVNDYEVTVLSEEDDEIPALQVVDQITRPEHETKPHDNPPLYDQVKKLPRRGGDQEKKKNSRDEEEGRYDLVVVGSGVAGLYSLYTLYNTRPEWRSKRVLMIEQASRIGGRLQTEIIRDTQFRVPDSVNTFVKCEEGGMRFCVCSKSGKVDKDREVMPLLLTLMEELDPHWRDQIEEFKMVPDGNVDFRRQWFDGSGFTMWYADQNTRIWDEVFCLEPQHREKGPGQIWTEVYIRILRENYSTLVRTVGGNKRKAEIVLAQHDMAQVRLIQDTAYWSAFSRYFTWRNVAMCRYTTRSLLTLMGYSQGCIKMLQETGFQCFTKGTGNAGTVLQMSRTHIAMEDAFYCFKTGFHTLIEELRKAVESLAKGNLEIRTDKKLVTIHRKRQVLGMEDGPCRIEVQDIGVPTDSFLQPSINTYLVKSLILAIPRKALEAVRVEGMHYQERVIFSELLNSVCDVPMTKINLYFQAPWWNPKQFKNKLYGRSTTSLPISQVYPWYSQPGGDERDSGSIQDVIYPQLCALTIYCDIENSGFWSDLQNIPGLFSSELQIKYCNLNSASLEVVKEALKELKLLFNDKDVPYPVLATYTRWAGCPTDCGNPVAIHQWRRDVDEAVVQQKITKPIKGSNVFVCNEAWSSFQGWVEGSLMAAERVTDMFPGHVIRK